MAYLIPAEDMLKYKAIAILDNIELEQLNFYSLIHRQKAFIHTWLAWQAKSGMPMLPNLLKIKESIELGVN